MYSKEDATLVRTVVGANVIKENIEVANMELKDTIGMMTSGDYKERFKAEYWQTKIRYEKLHRFCVKYEAGTLDFEPDCPLSLLVDQKKYMGQYLHSLELRAEIEGIDLNAPYGK